MFVSIAATNHHLLVVAHVQKAHLRNMNICNFSRLRGDEEIESLDKCEFKTYLTINYGRPAS